MRNVGGGFFGDALFGGGECGPLEHVGAAAGGAGDALLAAPPFNGGVIAGGEDVGHTQAAVLGWARVLGVLEQAGAVRLLGERVLGAEDAGHEARDSVEGTVEYIFEPPQKVLLGELLPVYLRTVVLQALLEAAASEHGARMTAMENATTNASDMIERLTLSMNRARQATITTELMEIVSGAEALKG